VEQAGPQARPSCACPCCSRRRACRRSEARSSTLEELGGPLGDGRRSHAAQEPAVVEELGAGERSRSNRRNSSGSTPILALTCTGSAQTSCCSIHTPPASGRMQTGHHPDRGRLPCAVRTHQTVDKQPWGTSMVEPVEARASRRYRFVRPRTTTAGQPAAVGGAAGSEMLDGSTMTACCTPSRSIAALATRTGHGGGACTVSVLMNDDARDPDEQAPEQSAADIRTLRLQKLDRLRAGGAVVYPYRFDRDRTLAELREEFEFRARGRPGDRRPGARRRRLMLKARPGQAHLRHAARPRWRGAALRLQGRAGGGRRGHRRARAVQRPRPVATGSASRAPS